MGDDAKTSGQSLALAALVGGALIIGAAPILVRLGQAGPAAIGVWRLAFALPLLALMDFRNAPGGPGLPTRWMLVAGVAFAADLGFWHYGIRFTNVANATVLPNLTPVLVTLFSWLVLKDRPKGGFLAGMIVAMSGAVMMALAGGKGGPGSNPHLGDALSALTAVAYGVYFLAVQAARRTARTGQVMLWSGIVGLPFLLALAIAAGERLTPTDAAGWAALAALGVVHVTGQGAIAWALGRLPASTGAVIVLVQPVAAALLAWLIFRESLSPLQAIGGALALGGVALSQLRRRTAPALS